MSPNYPREPATWDLRCLLCGRLAGQVVDAAFVHDPNCALEPRFEAGRRRCCGCGGSLLREPGSGPQVKVTAPQPHPLVGRRRSTL
jgi:hypothetical protein